MASPFIWTIREADAEYPFCYVMHEGPESTRFIEQQVARATALGWTVVVGFGRTTARARRLASIVEAGR